MNLPKSESGPTSAPPFRRKNRFLGLGLGVVALTFLIWVGMDLANRLEHAPDQDSRGPLQPIERGSGPAFGPEVTAIAEQQALHQARNDSNAYQPVGDQTGPLYHWKKDTIYRYQWEKTIHLTRQHQDEKKAEQANKIGGILVFEVKEVDAEGTAQADLRVDSPKLKLPWLYAFDAASDLPKPDPERLAILVTTLEECLRSISWNVRLESSGRMLVLSREPSDFRKWTEDVLEAGDWTRKSVAKIANLVDDQLQWWGGRVDDELFVVGGSPGKAASGTEKEAALDRLRPVRRVSETAEKPEERRAWRFSREAPKRDNPVGDLLIPYLNTNEKSVRIGLRNSGGLGESLFDTRLGMLDNISEQYWVDMDVTCANRKLDQRVAIHYTLRRLAPPIREKTLAEDPGK